MKRIIIITGKTGAGKSTLCKSLQEYFQFPLLSFANMGKEFANKNGYQRIRQCNLDMKLEDFIEGISTHIFDTIDKQLNTCDYILVDGLYIAKTVLKLKEKYDCSILYLKASNTIRYERIAERLSITVEQARVENNVKEKLKDDVGIDILIKNSSCIIDGNKSQNEVFNDTKEYIENYVKGSVLDE